MPPRTISHPPSAQRAPWPPPTFVAIDFETADYRPDSVCALVLVRVEAGLDVATTAVLSAATESFTATAPHFSTYQ